MKDMPDGSDEIADINTWLELDRARDKEAILDRLRAGLITREEATAMIEKFNLGNA